MKHIAIFGATSYLAKDLIRSFAKNTPVTLDLYTRKQALVEAFCETTQLNIPYHVLTYQDFNQRKAYDAIINCIGVGDPAVAIKMGASIFQVTCQYDNLVMDYLQHHPETKYVFLSSGAVYGSNFCEPVTSESCAKVAINNTALNDWYGKSKLYAELGHRSRSDLNIVDVRVFNYFSATLDLSSSYLVADLLRSIRDKTCLLTSKENISRDYLHPDDLYQLMQCILQTKPINQVFDCYSKAPIDKMTMLKAMQERFGLQYRFSDEDTVFSSLNYKKNYYSLNKSAASIGYVPSRTSLEGLLQETEKFLRYEK